MTSRCPARPPSSVLCANHPESGNWPNEDLVARVVGARDRARQEWRPGRRPGGRHAGFISCTMRSARPACLCSPSNAAHLRVIPASRKKTDRRDAYWIAKSLQTGMTPHVVYVPGGEIRELRRLLARRALLKRDLKRWQVRARALLRGARSPRAPRRPLHQQARGGATRADRGTRHRRGRVAGHVRAVHRHAPQGGRARRCAACSTHREQRRDHPPADDPWHRTGRVRDDLRHGRRDRALPQRADARRLLGRSAAAP